MTVPLIVTADKMTNQYSNTDPQVPHWSVSDVLAWLSSLHFPSCVSEAISEAKVDGDLLLQITEKNLKEDLGMTNGIHRKRFMRELNELKKKADYSSVDANGIAKFLECEVGLDYRIYAYSFIKCDLNLNLMRRLNAIDLNDVLIEAEVTSSIHRRKIIDAIFTLHESASSHAFSRSASSSTAHSCESSPSSDSGLDISVSSSFCSNNSNNIAEVYVSFDKRSAAELASLIMMQLQMRGFIVHCAQDDQGCQEKALKKIEDVENFVLVLAGPDGLDQLSHFMCQEISAALKSKSNIIPVLDNVTMNSEDTLPENIAAISHFNAVNWVHDYQEACLDKLEKFVLQEPFKVGRMTSGNAAAGSDRSTPTSLLTPVTCRKIRPRTFSTGSSVSSIAN